MCYNRNGPSMTIMNSNGFNNGSIFSIPGVYHPKSEKFLSTTSTLNQRSCPTSCGLYGNQGAMSFLTKRGAYLKWLTKQNYGASFWVSNTSKTAGCDWSSWISTGITYYSQLFRGFSSLYWQHSQFSILLDAASSMTINNFNHIAAFWIYGLI